MGDRSRITPPVFAKSPSDPNMRPTLRRLAFLLFASAWAMPAKADPLLFFLMSAAKEIAAAVARRPAPDPVALSVPVPPTTYPGTAVEPETLRQIIEDSFAYLSQAQRKEVFASLNQMLLDPKLGNQRAALIEYFLHKALAVRSAQMQLARLSEADKQRLAAQFRQETASLPEAERQQLLGLLEHNLLPVPADLNQLLLAELQEPR